ncbi:MAG: hypothetical protein JRG77_04910 [Deltaproteobacteria bacterium]|nr:hypothetical protein [Deltaproteobacteria bacterium]
MTAKTMDGKQVYNNRVVYMPYPGRFGVGAEMVKESFEIPFPYADVEKDGKKTRELTADELNVNTTLWYVPFGEFDGNEVAFFSDERKIELKSEWIWRK